MMGRSGTGLGQRTSTDMEERINKGVIAGANATVSHVAVASGDRARVDYRVTEAGDQGGPAGQLGPAEISELLAQLIDGLHRSDHPDRADLAEFAEDAREELAADAPRTGKLRRVARALVEAVPGVAGLASLAVTIEEAVRNL